MADSSGRDDVRGAGEAANGQVRADVGPDGLLAALHVDPRALRLGSQELARQIVVAVRTAQQAYFDRLDAGTEEPDVPEGLEPETLVQRLDELEVQALRDFDRLTSTLDKALRGLEDR